MGKLRKKALNQEKLEMDEIKRLSILRSMNHAIKDTSGRELSIQRVLGHKAELFGYG
jgi:hypothetical protein